MAKDYIGSGKKHDRFDNIVCVSIDLEKAKKHIFEYKGKKYLKFDVAEKREADQYGKTHSVSVFVPDGKNQNNDIFVSDDDVPF